MVHNYHCKQCDIVIETFVRNSNEQVCCISCNKPMKKLFSPTVNMQVWRPRVFRDLGPKPIYIENKSQLRKICKERGLDAVCLM